MRCGITSSIDEKADQQASSGGAQLALPCVHLRGDSEPLPDGDVFKEGAVAAGGGGVVAMDGGRMPANSGAGAADVWPPALAWVVGREPSELSRYHPARGVAAVCLCVEG